MVLNDWVKEFKGSVTVCDRQGIIIEMNDQAIKTFGKDGGEKLIGRNILDCHPGPARAKLASMMQEQKENVYTIEKNGVKKFIYQSPTYKDGKYNGFIEISLEIPFEMPHFIRSSK